MHESLAEHMAATYDDQISIEEEKPSFKIDTMDKAIWAMRKIAQAQEKNKAVQAQADAEMFRISAWVKSQKDSNDQQITFFEQLLRPFAEETLKGEKKRSLSLPIGTIGFRKGQEKFERDEEKLLLFVKKSAPTFIKTIESVKWAEFKETIKVDGNKAVTADGEIVDGVKIEAATDSFYVKVGK